MMQFLCVAIAVAGQLGLPRIEGTEPTYVPPVIQQAMRGGKEPPDVDFDAEKKILAYLERRVPSAKDGLRIIDTISLKGCYAVPSGQGRGTDPKQATGKAAAVKRPLAEGGLAGVDPKFLPDRDWKPLGKEGIAVAVTYPAPGKPQG